MIISFNLMTLMCDSVVIPQGEIRYQSLSGVTGWRDILLIEVTDELDYWQGNWDWNHHKTTESWLKGKNPKYSYHNIIKFSLYPKTL